VVVQLVGFQGPVHSFCFWPGLMLSWQLRFFLKNFRDNLKLAKNMLRRHLLWQSFGLKKEPTKSTRIPMHHISYVATVIIWNPNTQCMSCMVYLPPGSLTVRPWKYTIPKGEACLPFPSFFRGELLSPLNFGRVPTIYHQFCRYIDQPHRVLLLGMLGLSFQPAIRTWPSMRITTLRRHKLETRQVRRLYGVGV